MATTLERVKALIDEQNRTHLRMQEIQNHSDGWNAERRENWDTANARMIEIEGDMERLNRALHLETVDFNSVLANEQDATGDQNERTVENDDERYERVFRTFTRGGLDALEGPEKQLLMGNRSNVLGETRVPGGGQVVATNSLGGYLVPPGYRAVMTETMKAFGGVLNLANVITTSTGQPLQWPSNNDTGNVGAILEEANQITQQDVTFGTKTLGAYVYTSKLVLVSMQLLQDSAFNLDTWLPGKLGERIGRAVAAHLVTGTGTAQPEGVATNVTTGTTGTGATAISYDNLIDLEHSIDPAYRGTGRCRFLMNDTTLSSIRKLKDSMGRPLWLPVPTQGMPATINGLPYTIDQAVASPAASAKSIIFGDFQLGYIVRQVMDVQMVRLTERYADYLQVGFFGFARLDAEPDDTAALRAFVHGT